MNKGPPYFSDAIWTMINNKSTIMMCQLHKWGQERLLAGGDDKCTHTHRRGNNSEESGKQMDGNEMEWNRIDIFEISKYLVVFECTTQM